MTIPSHIAIIMDGNGRWASARKLSRSEGHGAGYENVRNIVEIAAELGVNYLTLFAFSTENWERPEEEVSHILSLAAQVIHIETEGLHKNGVRVRHIGRLDRLPFKLREEIKKTEILTKENLGLNLSIAFDYGGRHDIIQGIKRLIRDGVPEKNITESLLAKYLFTSDIPDPDLIIRTGGEFRISNFLIWQGAYAEFHSCDSFWPDFDRLEFEKALETYATRDRKFGRVK